MTSLDSFPVTTALVESDAPSPATVQPVPVSRWTRQAPNPALPQAVRDKRTRIERWDPVDSPAPFLVPMGLLVGGGVGSTFVPSSHVLQQLLIALGVTGALTFFGLFFTGLVLREVLIARHQFELDVPNDVAEAYDTFTRAAETVQFSDASIESVARMAEARAVMDELLVASADLLASEGAQGELTQVRDEMVRLAAEACTLADATSNTPISPSESAAALLHAARHLTIA